jgi:hypothetical protein
MVPPDSLVGGIGMTGPVRLYAGMESFRWDYAQTGKLIRDFLNKGRPIYLLIEPWYIQHPAIEQIAQIFDLKTIAIIPETMGTVLSQVSLRQE